MDLHAMARVVTHFSQLRTWNGAACVRRVDAPINGHYGKTLRTDLGTAGKALFLFDYFRFGARQKKAAGGHEQKKQKTGSDGNDTFIACEEKKNAADQEQYRA